MSSAVLRSVLFVPASRPDRFEKALNSQADAVIFDLEDAVEASQKAGAREALGQFLISAPAPVQGGTARFVRINAASSTFYDDDIKWLSKIVAFADAVILPKVAEAAELERLAHVVSDHAERPNLGVIPMLETARGILHAPEILSARARIPAAIFGAEDLTAELGIPRTLGGDELLYARSRIALAAATIGADAIDAVWVRFKDFDGLREDSMRARSLGFRGKSAIHPDQIAIINETFRPTADEIALAQQVIDADDRARAAGAGAFRLHDEMVDAPVVARARRVLAVAERLRGRS